MSDKRVFWDVIVCVWGVFSVKWTSLKHVLKGLGKVWHFVEKVFELCANQALIKYHPCMLVHATSSWEGGGGGGLIVGVPLQMTAGLQVCFFLLRMKCFRIVFAESKLVTFFTLTSESLNAGF